MTESAACPHCPDGHDNPRSKPWGVYVSPTRDGDGQHTTLHVAPSNGSHVAESDAEWLRALIRGEQASASQIIDEILAPLQASLATAEFEHHQAHQRAKQAEATLARVREVHQVHSCERDGHILASTPTPCVNDGCCSCGSMRCPTLAAIDSPEGTNP